MNLVIGIAAFGAGLWLLVESVEGLIGSLRGWALASGISGVLVGGLLMPVFGDFHGMKAFALVVAGGLAGGAGQLLMTSSLRAPVSVVSPFDYLQIVAATAYGWLLFSDVPSAHTLVGAALIAMSGLYTAWREHRRRLDQAAAAAVPAV